MNKGPKVFAASLLFGYLYWRSLKPRISILNKDAVAGSLSFTMSVEGITFTDTIFLTDDKSIILAEGGKYWFITEPDEDRTGVNLSIAENLKPGGAYDVVASEWVRVTPFAAISGGKEPEIEWTDSYNRGVYVTTDIELTGRGITKSGNGEDHARGKKTFHVTEAAWKKLQPKYTTQYYSNSY